MRGTDAYAYFSHIENLIRSQTELDKKAELVFLQNHFKDYEPSVDKQIFTALFNKYHSDLENEWKPDEFSKLMRSEKAQKKLAKLYANSVLTDKNKLEQLISSGNKKQIENKLEKNRLIRLFTAFSNLYSNSILPEYNRITQTIDDLQTDYVGALMEMQKDGMIYPDANQTLRVSYGTIEGYEPADGIIYDYYTTIDGIIQKDNPDIYDYDVPDRLKELYREKDFGNYANAKGELPVCFTASNHTTGGNSGSPVLDQNGYLIGINFDRCWEGTMSDIMFDPEKCRNISLDMRYMLFLIDKFAGAGYLLNEMKIMQ